jgi:hypothetical protein
MLMPVPFSAFDLQRERGDWYILIMASVGQDVLNVEDGVTAERHCTIQRKELRHSQRKILHRRTLSDWFVAALGSYG